LQCGKQYSSRKAAANPQTAQTIYTILYRIHYSDGSNSVWNKFEPNYQASFTVRKSSLNIFVELDFGLNSHDNSKTKYLYDSKVKNKNKIKIDSDYLEIITI